MRETIMQRSRSRTWRSTVIAFTGGLLAAQPRVARASDHLDTPTVIADPAADIADLFAWTSADGRRLNLVMTVIGKRFSDHVQYVFHVDSGSQIGETRASTSIACQFDAAGAIECWAGDADHVRGDASKPTGLDGQHGRFRVFAGLRDDPFFNNVKGTREALGVVAEALHGGAALDGAGCPALGEATAHTVFDRWRHTGGGPAVDFLAGWKIGALVIAVDLDVVTIGGPVLGTWAGTYRS